MSYSYNLVQARTSSAANPITASITLSDSDKLVVVMIKGVGATNRAGGSPTWGSHTFVQANSTQKAVTSPEASAELWYVLNPFAGTKTLTIPNTGAITCLYTVCSGQPTGKSATFLVANGGNNTSTNPTPGSVTLLEPGILFGITAGGWTTWAPSSQAGTIIANTDDGAHGGGEQYKIQTTPAAVDLNWTFATSDDWGAVSAAFGETPSLILNNYLAHRTNSNISISS